MRNVYGFSVGKHTDKCPLARPKRKWENNMRSDLREISCEDGRLMELAQDRVQ